MGTKKYKESLPSFFNDNGKILTEVGDIAEGFNSFFSGIGPELANAIPPTNKNFQDYLGNPKFQNFSFSNVSSNVILTRAKGAQNFGF